MEVSSTLADVNRVLGTELSYADVEDVFRRLGFGLSGNARKLHSERSSSPLGHHYRSGPFEEIAPDLWFMTNYQQPFQKMMGQPVN